MSAARANAFRPKERARRVLVRSPRCETCTSGPALASIEELPMTETSPTQPRRIPYVLAALTALLLWGFGSVADEVIDGETLAFDTAVTSFFREAGNPNDPWGPTWLEEAMRDITGLGSFTILGFVLLATVVY